MFSLQMDSQPHFEAGLSNSARLNSPHLDSTWRTAVRKNIRAWYRRNLRDLPWRKTSDPYRVWLSEIMLQQTQVVTVIPYYQAFVEAFPTVHDLADAEEATIMRMWEGLGYYRRAKQMHAAAKQVVEQHDGAFPDNFKDVLNLPGIGRYTAGAILSIAHDQPLPILEGNTIRLHARLTGYEDDVKTKDGQSHLWDVAEQMVAKNGTGELNQAFMELGATVCLPRNPKCLICPLKNQCLARRQGAEDRIPFTKSKMKYEDRIETAVVITRQNAVLMKQYQEGERWAGLWDLPRFQTVESPVDEATRDALVSGLKKETGLKLLLDEPHLKLKHAVTRFRITLFACHAKIASQNKDLLKPNKPWQWMEIDSLDSLPLHVTGRKITSQLKRESKDKRSR